MFNTLKILRGLLIGCSLIIPGVSGGTMAVSMGIYDQLIDLVTVSGATKRRFVGLLPYMFGILLGIAIFSYFIERMFESYPLQTAFLFTGLILGALPMLVKKVRPERFRPSHAIVLAGVTAIMIYMPLTSRNAGAALTLELSFIHVLLCAGLGFITAATMVVPGVSGSMLLIILGYYEPILQSVNRFTAALFLLDIDAMLSSLGILLPYSAGAVTGVIVMSRIIRVLLTRFPYTTYYAIIGLVAASPIAVLYQQGFAGASLLTYIICALMLAAGFFAAVALGKGDKIAGGV